MIVSFIHYFCIMKLTLRLLALIITTFAIATSSYAQFAETPKREYRAVWLTTIKGLDWPKSISHEDKREEEAQQAALCAILDSLQAININTILLQTRIRGDVIYPSEIEPFSPVFTGKYGVAPSYDPLAFAIEECHKRGMQLHAWLVTIPIGDDAHVKSHGKQSLPSQKPKQCTRFKGSWYMEPSHPSTQQHLTALVKEVVTHYDVDGIHFDYIRYPEGNRTYPDESIYRQQSSGKRISKADWRRKNITSLMQALYTTVKDIKPWVCVSAATLGKHDDTSRYSSYGWNAYHTVHQEAKEWMRTGIIDAIFPMLYYTGKHFYPFVADWSEGCHGRHVVAGMGTYQLHKDEKNWELEEIVRQLNVVRAYPIGGAAQFRSMFVTENTKGVYDYLKLFYPNPALVPAMTWQANRLPDAPRSVNATIGRYTTTITWDSASDTLRYNIYSCETFPVNVDDPALLEGTYIRGNTYSVPTQSLNTPRHYAVTAIDRYGNESAPLQWENKTIGPIKPKDIQVTIFRRPMGN